MICPATILVSSHTLSEAYVAVSPCKLVDCLALWQKLAGNDAPQIKECDQDCLAFFSLGDARHFY